MTAIQRKQRITQVGKIILMMSHSTNGFKPAYDNSSETAAEIVLPAAYSNGGFVQVRMAPIDAKAALVAADALDAAESSSAAEA